MGQYDFLNLIEAPDEQTMAKAAIMLARAARCVPQRFPRFPSRISSPDSLQSSRARNAVRERLVSDPPGAAAAFFAQIVFVEQHGQDRSVGSAAHLVAPVALFADTFGDLEAPRPCGFEAGPDFDARAGAHGCIVRP